MPDYLTDPAAIYAESFRMISAEVDFSAFPQAVHPLVSRVVHSCGMVEVVEALRFFGDPATVGRAALAEGKPVLVDVQMVAHGVIQRLLPHQNDVVCTLNQADVPALAAELGTTRSAAALELWVDRLDGAVVAIGNAPTALFRLIEMIQGGAPKPAVIFGFPVGFVGAAESKQYLIEADLGIPYMTLPDRRGGSAMAAAAVNGLTAGAR